MQNPSPRCRCNKNTQPDGVNNTGSEPLADCLAVAAATPQRVGASLHPPLDSTSRVASKELRARGLATPATELHAQDPFRKSPSKW